MENIKNITQILRENPRRNISLINLIENDLYDNIHSYNTTIIVKRKTRIKYYLSSDNEKDLRGFLVKSKKEGIFNDKVSFSSVEDWIIHIIKEYYNIKIYNYGFKVYLPDKIILPDTPYQAEKVTVDYAELINDTWEHKKYNSLEYIKNMINNGKGYIIYDKGEPVSWILTHYDGSLGFLYVKEEYRRKGYGVGVTVPLINDIRSENKLPFAHILENNTKSLNMFTKLGFEKLSRVCWFSIL